MIFFLSVFTNIGNAEQDRKYGERQLEEKDK